MQTIYTGLIAGFIVGVVCVLYVLFRSWRIETSLHGRRPDSEMQNSISNHWMIMGIFSSASLVWGFVGAGIFHLLEDWTLFLIFSIVFAVIVTVYLVFKDTSYKTDKIVLNLIIVIGLGVLIPYIY